MTTGGKIFKWKCNYGNEWFGTKETFYNLIIIISFMNEKLLDRVGTIVPEWGVGSEQVSHLP